MARLSNTGSLGARIDALKGGSGLRGALLEATEGRGEAFMVLLELLLLGAPVSAAWERSVKLSERDLEWKLDCVCICPILPPGDKSGAGLSREESKEARKVEVKFSRVDERGI